MILWWTSRSLSSSSNFWPSPYPILVQWTHVLQLAPQFVWRSVIYFKFLKNPLNLNTAYNEDYFLLCMSIGQCVNIFHLGRQHAIKSTIRLLWTPQLWNNPTWYAPLRLASLWVGLHQRRKKNLCEADPWRLGIISRVLPILWLTPPFP